MNIQFVKKQYLKLMKEYNILIANLNAIKTDIEKFYLKGNKSAGKRARRALRKLEQSSFKLRKETIFIAKQL